jgi:hypothetical protein
VDVKGLQGIEGYAIKPCRNERCKQIIAKSINESSPSNNTNSRSSLVLLKFEVGDELQSSTLEGSQQLVQCPRKVCLKKGVRKFQKISL